MKNYRAYLMLLSEGNGTLLSPFDKKLAGFGCYQSKTFFFKSHTQLSICFSVH